jgi:linearmycin/streptolysin S transport system permease protein
MLRPALLIAGKDLRQRARDRSAFLVAIVVPLALAAIFALTLSDVSSGDITFDVALADEDRGPVAAALQSDVLRPLQSSGLIRVETAANAAEARRLVDGGHVAAAILLPAGLSTAVHAGARTRLEVVGDRESPIGVLVTRSLVDGFTGRIAAVRLAVAAARVDAETAQAAASTPPLRLEDVSTQSRELEPATFYAAGMAVFFLFFAVQLGITSLLAERRDGTLARMLVAPVPRRSVVLGKLLTSFVVGVVSMGVLALATRLLLGAHWGDPLGVAALIVAGVLAATGATALVATLARTPEQAGVWSSIVALVLGMLGGAFFPVAQAGGLIERISLLTPHAWFLRGLGDLSGHGGVGAVAGPVAFLLAFATVTGAVAFARLGRLARP